MNPSIRQGERGAALLTVLLLVAVIAVLAASALEKVRLSTRLAANGAAIDQSRAYALAAETLATGRINALLGRDAARVTLAGGWNGTPYPLPIPEGTATATVTDGGNCFNLNGLVTRGEPGVLVARTEAIAQFTRLMRLLDISENVGAGIAAATADWIDSDDVPLPFGAEDSTYLARTPAYRTGNGLMADVSEFRAVVGVTPTIYATMQRWICAQPRTAVSRINVNTLMPEQAVLFAMLLPDTLSIGTARNLLLERPPQGFTSTVEFWKRPALQGITAGPEAQAQTAVTTQWFNLRVDVALGGTELTQTALIDATAQPVRLVSRQWDDPS